MHVGMCRLTLQFYVIVDGAVEVSKIVHRSNGQRETIILEVLEKDCWFGEIALIKETVRLATVTCREDCLFLTVTKDKVIEHHTPAHHENRFCHHQSTCRAL